MEIKKLGENSRPLICLPLVGRTRSGILIELSQLLAKGPDLVEWRADFFCGIDEVEAVVELGREIKERAGDVPVIFTIRSEAEGGEKVGLSAWERIKLNAKIAAETGIEYLDCELANEKEQIEFLRSVAQKEHGKKIIGSFHQHEYTPNTEILCEKIFQAETLGLDVAKIAVMPQNRQDVLVLWDALLTAGEKTGIPIIAISMGKYGLISRLAGGIFGSAVTFAVGVDSSAPGQVAIEDVRAVLEIIEKNNRALRNGE
ncbi:MAG: type I 3-dehydroquinate dehydratase [Sporomusaceae bacterium]|jgi:3-dehydroquinate dehydratase-1|nr:type I 3-dehydroquinate dehydratase [Sporomusaceae bacterium]